MHRKWGTNVAESQLQSPLISTGYGDSICVSLGSCCSICPGNRKAKALGWDVVGGAGGGQLVELARVGLGGPGRPHRGPESCLHRVSGGPWLFSVSLNLGLHGELVNIYIS